jgi:putative two-component system response regulator
VTQSGVEHAPDTGLGTGARELVGAIQQLAMARTNEEIQRIVRSAARRLAGSDGATFVLRDGERCFYVDEDAISPLWKGMRFPLEQCISGWSMLNRQPVAIPDIYLDARIPHDAYRPTFVKSLVMVPIRQVAPVGAIGNYWAHEHQATPAEIEILQALADSTAVAIENVRVLEELEGAHRETLHRLALAGEYRDDDTRQHTERVSRTTRELALELGLAEREAALIGQAALLHDIGKVSIDDAILRKPGRLTPEEFELVKGHAATGAAILFGSQSAILRLAQEIALAHHERWDGTGYPNGLAGDEIPLAGRIVALADVFDALTHARPYKGAWPVEDALIEIERLAGTHFDPEVVSAFRRLDAQALVDQPEIAFA